MAVTLEQINKLGNSTILEYAQLPNQFLDGFWMIALFVIWGIIGMSFYWNGQREKNDGNILSSFGISSFICFVLLHVSTLGGLITGQHYFYPFVVFLVVIVTFLAAKGKRERSDNV